MRTPLFYLTRGLLSASLGTAILYSFPCMGQTPDTQTEPPKPPVFPTGEGTPLGAQIAALLADPGVSRAHWGIAVTALDGTAIYGLDEGKFFRPASNAKLFTTAAAMALLGPQATVTTKVFGDLDANGTVTGDLELVGAADANFASDDLPYVPPAQRPKNAPQPQPIALDDLRTLADQLAAKGVRRVTGRVVGDDTLFPHEPFADSWDVGDLVWGYGAPVSALTIADNEMKLTVTPGTVTGPKGHERYAPVTVTLEQNGVPYYTVNSQVDGTAAGTGSHVSVERLPGSRELRVYGSIAVDAEPDVEHVSIDDPALYAAMALRQLLVERGIAVDGEAKAQHQVVQDARGFLSAVNEPLSECEADAIAGNRCAPSCPMHVRQNVLASKVSAPLAEDVTLTLKVSQNLHAEMLLHRLGVWWYTPCRAGDTGSTVEGARIVRGFLLRAGLDPKDFVFYDGSGLSGHDLVTPRATAQLLAYATKQPWFAQWKAALPVGGEDGTLSSRFPDAPLKDHLFAKTGTLGESRGLSGYVDAASGHQVIFSIFVDDHAPNGSNDRAVMDKIVAAIAANE
jgi:D-alanyl-D-alanine carboxypeptidase/D-alanyl-D-alanine-endopeptidase (penicillin-binding protein 4)